MKDYLNNKEEQQGHICPYCGHIEMQINNHFAHMEIWHKNNEEDENETSNVNN